MGDFTADEEIDEQEERKMARAIVMMRFMCSLLNIVGLDIE
jgi:hypothetical protein